MGYGVLKLSFYALLVSVSTFPRIQSLSRSVFLRNADRKGRYNLYASKNISDQRDRRDSSSHVLPSSSRTAAVFALVESSRKKGTIALRCLEASADYNGLDQRDRAFARLLLSTTERRQGQIDQVVGAFIKKTKSRKRASDNLCESALRIGTAQLLFLDTPSYAAVQETVDVLKVHPTIKVAKSQVSFVNAVLRRVDTEGAALLQKSSILDNVNTDLVQQWIKTYGEERTKCIVEISMKQSPIFVSVNHPMGSSDSQSNEKLEEVKQYFSMNSIAGESAELLQTGSIRVPEQLAPLVSSWPGYHEGDWWVQDAAAALPAIALHRTIHPDGGRDKLKDLHVVDLCSAPGGKTAQLCSLGFGRVTAIEVSRRRTKQLRENLRRLGMVDQCNVVVSDGREWYPQVSERIDAVLVDAPCSATGVASRRPDVLRKSIDLDELHGIQRDLMVHTVDNLLAAGSVMIYATCSLLKSESEDQMNWLLAREEGRKIEPLPFQRGEIPGFDDAIDESGWLRVIPGELDGTLASCDGFFVARIRRVD